MLPNSDEVPTILQQLKEQLDILQDSTQNDVTKLKALQGINDNFEVILTTRQQAMIVDQLLRVFVRLLQETSAQFIGENNTQQLRKLMLEMTHRMPCNEHLKQYSKVITGLLFKLVEVENEENVLVCLRILIEHLKQFRATFTFNADVRQFINFVKSVYRDLGSNVAKMFEPQPQLHVKDITELNIPEALERAFIVTPVHTEQRMLDQTPIVYTVLPRGSCSLKVLAELPIIVVLLYQLYKQDVSQDLMEFVPLVLNAISLQPTRTDTNLEIFIEFMSAQIKTLSFLAYIVRIYPEHVALQSHLLVQGLLRMMAGCPPETSNLRKELLIAARHILMTDLRTKFVPVINQLFDEKLMIGGGWTAYDGLRPLAYSTLADLVHHIRTQLPPSSLILSIQMFSRNVHDPTLPCSIQAMSCKLLLNLVECMVKNEVPNARELLLQMMEVFVRKFKVVAREQLPLLMEKAENYDGIIGATTAPDNPAPTDSQSQTIVSGSAEEVKPAGGPVDGGLFDTDGKINGNASEKEDKLVYGFPNHYQTCGLNDCRGLVKTLVCGVKTIAWAFGSVRSNDPNFAQSKFLCPSELENFHRLIRDGLKSLEVYMLISGSQPHTYQKTPATTTVRTKEEKEVLEHFAGVFSILNLQNFKELFSVHIGYLVDRIGENYALQIIPNAFLANSTTTTAFATILIGFLLERLEEMGSNPERSNLYLKLFKLLFGSVQLFAAENEQMLKPQLHKLVNKSMEFALTAKEPYHYFVLLRSLFRSIGGGSHDILYQEFLPLLPTLLQGLNSLQSGKHKQHIKEIFVELCLTVPVRLSSLLPYLPLLMDPLVSALHGTPSLVAQGLRTLELCVDNLQPDFLYEHISPVRGALMEALWDTVTHGSEQAALVAFRILGKFGGSNRKMLNEPTKFNYRSESVSRPSITVAFKSGDTPSGALMELQLPIFMAVETALNNLQQPEDESGVKKASWQLVRSFIFTSLSSEKPSKGTGASVKDDVATDSVALEKIDSQDSLEKELAPLNLKTMALVSNDTKPYICNDGPSRMCMKNALLSMFVAANNKDLKAEVLPILTGTLRHFVLLAVKQYTKPLEVNSLSGMDIAVLVEVVGETLSCEDRELCAVGLQAVSVLLETTSLLFGSAERAVRLPLLMCLSDEICNLCYEQSWYAKQGGNLGIKLLLDTFPESWVIANVGKIFRALMFTFSDLIVEVSNGCFEMARLNIETLMKALVQAAAGSAAEMKNKEATEELIQICVSNLSSCSRSCRQQSLSVLNYISRVTTLPLGLLLAPFAPLLDSTIFPPHSYLQETSVPSQIGLLEALAFGLSLFPVVISLDMENPSHKRLFDEIVFICESDETANGRGPWKSATATEMLDLRRATLDALLSCSEVLQCREKVFPLLYKWLTCNTAELQETAFRCLKTYLERFPVDNKVIHESMKPLLLLLSDYKSLNLFVARKLSYLTSAFPNTFNEKLCDQLLSHLKKWSEVAAMSQQSKGVHKFITGEMEICATILEIFHQIPAASSRFVLELVPVVGRAEANMGINKGSPWRVPLLKFLIRYPNQTVEYFSQEAHLKEDFMVNLFLWLLKQPEGLPLRMELEKNPQPLWNVLMGSLVASQTQAVQQSDLSVCLVIRIIGILTKVNPRWMVESVEPRKTLHCLWVNEDFRKRFAKDGLDSYKWKTPKTIVKCLFKCFQANTNDLSLLFDLMYAFTGKYLADFQFLKAYLLKDVAETFSVPWKRSVFTKFMDMYNHESTKREYEFQAKLLQWIIIPCVRVSFERGETDALIGTAPNPDLDSDDNMVSLFVRVLAIIQPTSNSMPDCLRILIAQLSCLFVEYAAPHIHDTSSKKQGKHGNRLRQFMLLAWPCLQANVSIDPTTRYHGHLLISYIIDKFAINRKIVLQVFHSLMKAHQQEAKAVIRQALNTLTPAVPIRMEDGHTQLIQIARRMLIEEGYSQPQLTHLLNIFVRHYKVYYVVRHKLMHHIVGAMQRLGFVQSVATENRKLAVDLAELVIKWELTRLKVETGGTETAEPSATGSQQTTSEENKPIERVHIDSVVNFLVRMSCQMSEQSNQQQPNTSEALSRRCLQLLKVALKPDLWGNTAELKLVFIEKILLASEQASNLSLICVVLDVVTFLIGALPQERVYDVVRTLQAGIGTCLGNPNTKVIKSLYSLLTKLIAVLNSDTSGLTGRSIEELEHLSASILKTVHEGLSNFEKFATSTPPSPSSLYPALSLLKAMAASQPSFIDRNHLIPPYLKVIEKLTKEHLNTTSAAEVSQSFADLLILSLELVDSCSGAMSTEQLKQMLTVMNSLIDKSPNAKVIGSIIRIVDMWMKKPDGSVGSQLHTPIFKREKHVLVFKLMQCLEKRFAERSDLLSAFLEIILFVYQSDNLKGSELTAKLEPAFLTGLQVTQQERRGNFFRIFNDSIKKNPVDRLLYIMRIQNWEPMGTFFWLKPCVEMMLAIVDTDVSLAITDGAKLPPLIDRSDEGSLVSQFGSLCVPTLSTTEELMEVDSGGGSELRDSLTTDPLSNFKLVLKKEKEFMQLVESVKCSDWVEPLKELCFWSVSLTEDVWINVFTGLWKLLTDVQRDQIRREITPFVASGVHTVQSGSATSVIKTLVEGFSRCDPPVTIRAPVLKYLGPAHGLWHRALLLLENMAVAQSGFGVTTEMQPEHFSLESPTVDERNEVLDSLADLYASLNETDMWVSAWNHRAKFNETKMALACEQQGHFEAALKIFEGAMGKVQTEFATQVNNVDLLPEFKLWENHWIKCSQELNQWDILKDYGNLRHINDPYLMVEAAWRIPNWSLVRDALGQIENCCPREMMWKIHLYRGFLNVSLGEDTNSVEKLAEQASLAAIREWRRLPPFVTTSHVPILQATQLIMELQEASQLMMVLLPQNINRASSFHDLKAIVKTWRNRLPTISDNLSYWGATLTWRQLLYQRVVSAFEGQVQSDPQQTGANHLGIHPSALTVVQFAKVARKQNLPNVGYDILQRLHTVPNLPVMDGALKVCQQLKCCLTSAKQSATPERDLQEALDTIESTNFTYLSKEVSADIYSMKGAALSAFGNRVEEANRAFSAALQLYDAHVKAWALWGEHLDVQFAKDRQSALAEQAVVCFLQAAAKQQSEVKSRKFIAKVLWLLKQEANCGQIHSNFAKYAANVTPICWLVWVPQLLNHMKATGSKAVCDVIIQIARSHPQAVFYVLRQHEPSEEKALVAVKLPSTQPEQSSSEVMLVDPGESTADLSQIVSEMTADIWKAMRDTSPVTTVALLSICRELEKFKEQWAETGLRVFRQTMAQCHAFLFKRNIDVLNTTVPDYLWERAAYAVESVRSKQLTHLKDPLLQKVVDELQSDFVKKSGSSNVLTFLSKMVQWIRTFEAQLKESNEPINIEEISPYLTKFSIRTADLDLPGELLVPKLSAYCIKIAKFLPHVEVVDKYGVSGRRFYMRGHNGKKYAYLLIRVSDVKRLAGCQRISQLFRVLNVALSRNKESASRLLQYSVASELPVAANMVLIAENPTSLSLFQVAVEGLPSKSNRADELIIRYYERLCVAQSREEPIRSSSRKEATRHIQEVHVGRDLLTNSVEKWTNDATNFYLYRKQVCGRISLICLAEFCLHLCQLYPEKLILAKNEGTVHLWDVTFNISDTSDLLESNSAVPFRISPVIADFLGPTVRGSLVPSFVAALNAAFTGVNFAGVLRPILWDQFYDYFSVDPTVRKTIQEINESVEKALQTIVQRVEGIRSKTDGDAKVLALISQAVSIDNLSLMDPSWHPWL